MHMSVAGGSLILYLRVLSLVNLYSVATYIYRIVISATSAESDPPQPVKKLDCPSFISLRVLSQAVYSG